MKARWTPTEDHEQIAVFRWAAYNRGRFPQLDNLFHVPNGGMRTKAEAGIFKQMGVRPGVPDIFLDWPAGGFHGLRIELKRTSGGRLSPAQAEWRDRLNAAGYCAVVCKGWEAAVKVIEDYLNDSITRGD